MRQGLEPPRGGGGGFSFVCPPPPPLPFSDTVSCPQYVLKPTFTAQQITNLDKQAKLSRAYDGTTYLPGIVGLNNIKANDYANAVLQVSLCGGAFQALFLG